MRKEACLACTKGGVRRCGLQGAYPEAAGVDGGAPVDDGALRTYTDYVDAVSIRAYNAQHTFKLESLSRINRYTRSARTFYNLNRYVSKSWVIVDF